MLDSAERPKLSVHFRILVFVGDFRKFVNFGWLIAGKHLSRDLTEGGSGLELLGSGVFDETFLWLVCNPGEENQLRFVGAQPLHVELELTIIGVSSSVVNSDSDGSGEAGAQVGSLELL